MDFSTQDRFCCQFWWQTAPATEKLSEYVHTHGAPLHPVYRQGARKAQPLNWQQSAGVCIYKHSLLAAGQKYKPSFGHRAGAALPAVRRGSTATRKL